MKILSVDTSTPTCTVGIVNGDRILAESIDSSGQTHARHLMGMIDKTITISGIPIQEIDGFAVVTGPGTFTGLRIGIGTIKGLAFALSKPVVGVTSLAALAAQADLSTKFVCPVIDARRNEVYYGLYVSEKGELQQIGKHRVAPPSELVRKVHESCQFIGNGARLYRKTFDAALGSLSRFSRSCRDTIQAGTLARLALKQFQENDDQGLHAVAPYYIRRSDAEVHAGKLYSSIQTRR
ncbi:MAG: tRNA (adenosine(37)-N6)-threonylcarbamoyltransferase complex dimerization subunit type 1 TsaB [Deltaproteobacteria bacterium]|nr:tRNA (adenosine(37)-N6)-threonylcarbamoyltransferase complex dimerization subunit type 1 TsaB [Deltaproteobacteria bacterium]